MNISKGVQGNMAKTSIYLKKEPYLQISAPAFLGCPYASFTYCVRGKFSQLTCEPSKHLLVILKNHPTPMDPTKVKKIVPQQKNSGEN